MVRGRSDQLPPSVLNRLVSSENLVAALRTIGHEGLRGATDLSAAERELSRWNSIRCAPHLCLRKRQAKHIQQISVVVSLRQCGQLVGAGGVVESLA